MQESHKPAKSLDEAILMTLAYSDIYDYPMRAAEVWRYLIGWPATLAEVERALEGPLARNGSIAAVDGYFFLPGRLAVVEKRRRRSESAKALWPVALRYGRVLAQLPYSRMVAVTGSLSVDNVDSEADVDYFIITANDRLWLHRALVVAIVRFAARRGIPLCPNYFLSERALVLTERNLYAAREVAQMMPLSGFEVYQRLRRENQWMDDYLPNARGLPENNIDAAFRPPGVVRSFRLGAEAVLRTPVGGAVEKWEMNRKVLKFRAMSADGESAFSNDYCKGHFESHGQRALALFEGKMKGIEKKEES